MFAGILGIGESSSGLNDHLSTQGIPVQLRRILGRKDFDAFSGDDDGIGFRLHVLAERAENGVILEKMRQGLCVGQIIYRHKFDVVPMQTCPDYISTDPAEAIDTNLY